MLVFAFGLLLPLAVRAVDCPSSCGGCCDDAGACIECGQKEEKGYNGVAGAGALVLVLLMLGWWIWHTKKINRIKEEGEIVERVAMEIRIMREREKLGMNDRLAKKTAKFLGASFTAVEPKSPRQGGGRERKERSVSSESEEVHNRRGSRNTKKHSYDYSSS